MSTFCQRVTVRIGVVFGVVVLSVAGSLMTRTAARASHIQTGLNARDAHGMTPLDYAVEQNDIGSVLALIHAGADVNARSNTGRTALSWAALHGYIEIARALAQAGADLNVKDAQGGTPFTLAFEAGHSEDLISTRITVASAATILRTICSAIAPRPPVINMALPPKSIPIICMVFGFSRYAAWNSYFCTASGAPEFCNFWNSCISRSASAIFPCLR